MKKMLLMLVLAGIAMQALSNPIDDRPQITISELFFDDQGQWELEIKYENEYDYQIDSFFLSSSSDTIKLTDLSYPASGDVFVLTESELAQDFSIQLEGDTITISFYYKDATDEPLTHQLIFGNCAGATVGKPLPGQSISNVVGYFVKDKSPTLNFLNDTAGTCGTLKGTIYGKSGEPVSREYLKLHFPFTTGADGRFSTRILARPNLFESLSYKTARMGIKGTGELCFSEVAYIDPLEFTMKPDSVITMDIHLRDSLLTALSTTPAESIPVNIYPNPIESGKVLNYEFDVPVESAQAEIKVHTVNGKLIHSENIHSTRGSVNLPGQSEDGVVLVSFYLNNKVVSTKRLLKSGK